MPYYEVQTTEAFGIPYQEFRLEPELEESLITIEFTSLSPSTPHPSFVFGDEVTLNDTHDRFRICALELIDDRWLYGIRTDEGTKELIWFEASELTLENFVDNNEL